ncbi:MAG: hypothetical protein ABS948_08390 [Solibacillus sp.]
MRLLIYILLTFIASVAAHFFQLIIGYGFLSMLFTAAGSPPGDLSRSSYIFFTMGPPLAFGVCLWIGYFVFINILVHFNIKLSLLFGSVLSVVLTVYLILCLLPLLIEDVSIPFSNFN